MTVAGTWTYTGNPATDSKDAVRYLVQDITSTDQRVSDEEILWAIASEGTVFRAAALVARTLASKYAQDAAKWVGDLKIEAAGRHKQYLDIAHSLERRALLAVNPSYGGTSISDKLTTEQGSDRVRPAFRRGMHDIPGLVQEAGSVESTST